MTSILTTEFWAYAGERAIKTVAQVLIAVIGTGAIGITQVDWVGAFSIAGTAAIVSILTSIVALETPSKPSGRHSKPLEDSVEQIPQSSLLTPPNPLEDSVEQIPQSSLLTPPNPL